MRKRDIITLFFVGFGLVLVIWISGVFMQEKGQDDQAQIVEQESDAAERLGRNPNPRTLPEEEKQEMLQDLERNEEPRNLSEEEKKGLIESLGRNTN